MKTTLMLQKPIVPQIFSAIRQAIVHMEYKPGLALSENELSLLFGVSRQPVREAFIKLSEVGLVTIKPSRGTFIKKISVIEVANARLVREAIECELVSLACQLATKDDHSMLLEILEVQHCAVKLQDQVLFNDNDDLFHCSIADIVDCEFAKKTLENSGFQLDRVRFLSLSESTPMQRLYDQHKQIVVAIIARDQVAAKAAMRDHLREVLWAVKKMSELYPELFEDFSLPRHASCITPNNFSNQPSLSKQT